MRNKLQIAEGRLHISNYRCRLQKVDYIFQITDADCKKAEISCQGAGFKNSYQQSAFSVQKKNNTINQGTKKEKVNFKFQIADLKRGHPLL